MTAPTNPSAPPDRTHAGRRVSVLRLLLVIAVVGGVIAAGTQWAMARYAASREQPPTTWFAPYVDVTLTPTFHFEDPAGEPSSDVVLAFVVADPNNNCLPSWGTYYSLDAAARALDLDRRVVRLRERGGDAMVSFGGALNNELSTVCTDPTALAAAYQSVIDRYGLTAIDFDIEGSSLADQAANARRTAAIEQLEAKNKGLAVWLTLPVDPNGLTADGLALVDQTLQAGVSIAGVNAMTMDFGGSRPPSMSMQAAIASSLNATWQQLSGAFARAGSPRAPADVWKMIGATPMIGQNDVVADVFTPADADALIQFAGNVDLGRLSFWSANRDGACGAGASDPRVSNTCSGVAQQSLEFSRIFGGPARPQPAPTAVPSATAEDGSPAEAIAGDDPRTSPYPIWRAAKAYETDAKVVWQGRVYQAKWWTQGDQPDAPVKHVWDTPWRYLGPVLESDRQAVIAGNAVTDGTVTAWAAEKVYVAGDEVQYTGDVFRAKWWTQGDTPEESPDQPYDAPWTYLGKSNTTPK